MPFCAGCGTQVEGKFCPKCGAVVDAAPATPPGTGAPPPVAVGAPMADNVAGALCYVLGLITGVIFLVLAPYNQNKTIRFHAFQSIFMNVGMIVVWIILSIVFRILIFIPVVGFVFAIVAGLLSLVIWLAWLCLWLFMMFQTYQGKTVVLPIIGPLAQKQA
jgi:uncharacterized membrane protein